MRLEHHLVGGYVHYISPHIIIIIIIIIILHYISPHIIIIIIIGIHIGQLDRTIFFATPNHSILYYVTFDWLHAELFLTIFGALGHSCGSSKS